MSSILIIDDDIDICLLLERFLSREGFEAYACSTGTKGLEILKEKKIDVILCDYRLPDGDGRTYLQKFKQVAPQVQVIIITGYSDVKIAIDVIKTGAYDYVTKPLLPDEILNTIKKAMAASGTEKEKTVKSSLAEETIRNSSASGSEVKYISGSSSLAQELRHQLILVAPTNYSVIIYGESGTGKESAAYTIHQHSKRKHKPFIAVDCGALTKELAGSELFGHEKGAFTGALQAKAGQFELANGGTILLDEIANLPYDVQVSLLRVIQERKVKRVGAIRETEIDVRIIVASNEILSDAVKAGKFREDLYHRFNEFSLTVPALRNRGKDIMEFAHFFLEKVAAELNKKVEGFSEEVITVFEEYSWPGNLRELHNVIKRAALLCNKPAITAEVLPQEIVFASKFKFPESPLHSVYSTATPGSAKITPSIKSAAINAEFEMIMETLKKVQFNKTKAAELLNIDRKTLYNKMKQYDILTNQ
jgi:two-component system response regulator HydG